LEAFFDFWALCRHSVGIFWEYCYFIKKVFTISPRLK
jgi:hypothetical protein